MAALALWPQNRALADSLNDYLGPRETAVGESSRADARGALAITLNPAGLALTSELVFEGAFGYRLADSASSVTLSGCDSTVAVPGCFYYRYFSASPELAGVESHRRVHDGGAVFGRMLTERVIVGVGIKYFDYNTDAVGDEDTSGFTFDVGAIVRPAEMVGLALVGHHLMGKDSAQYPAAVGAGLVLRPFSSLGFTADALWHLDRAEGQSTGRYGGGLEFFVRSSDMQTGYPVRAGVVHDVGSDGTYLSAGLGVAAAKLGVDLGARRQIAGGDELVVQASLRFFGPRQVMGSPQYR